MLNRCKAHPLVIEKTRSHSPSVQSGELLREIFCKSFDLIRNVAVKLKMSLLNCSEARNNARINICVFAITYSTYSPCNNK